MRISRLLPAVLVFVVFALGASPAFAETQGTGWEAFTQTYPTNLHPGGDGSIQIDLLNTGAKRSSGPIVVTDTLPKGVFATAAGSMQEGAGIGNKVEIGGVRWGCAGIGTEVVTCTSDPEYLVSLPSGEGLEKGGDFRVLERVGVEVEVKPGASEGTLENRVSIAGGGAAGVTDVTDPVRLSASEAGYGFSNWDAWFSNADGSVSTQAGSHPYETAFAVSYNALASGRTAGGEIRDLETELPPGFFGEPNSTPRCTRTQLDGETCPADTQIGENMPMFARSAGGTEEIGDLPVYNMVPPPGVVDQFAVVILGHTVFFDTGPRGYGDYNLVTHVDDIPAVHMDGDILVLWGVAPETSHNGGRQAGRNTEEGELCDGTGCSSTAPPRPFLTLPTSCGEPQTFTIYGQGTWEDEALEAKASVVSHNALDEPVGFTGCSNLSFDPSLTAAPDTSQADTPAGLGVNVTFPQEALRVPETLVEATVKNTTVTLPEGLVINPGQAAGLAACSDAQARLYEEGAPQCPLASKVGTVKVKTPLLEGALESELEGDVYVLEQSKGGPGEPPNLQSHPPALQLLIAISGDGIYLKLVANVQPNEATGQLTTTLTETPAVPFTDFELAFSGGAQAALATPAQCGTYSTTSDFTPWTSPFTPDLYPSSSFQVTGGPDGSACPSSPLPFHPELIAGSTTDQAGGYTDFSLLLQRGDAQQRIERLQFKAPEGLVGMISKVTPCGEAQANEPTVYGECPESSKIGVATVASGPGPYPLVIPQPGNPQSPIYLTGPYDGAPFGLSIVVHAIAGPFNLGTIVTRAKIEVNPITSQITVTTNQFPQIVDGVPTNLRVINSVIDRPGFMINPTNCKPTAFTGTAWGTPPPGALPGGTQSSGAGTSAPLSYHFQVGSCQALKFKPDFTVSTAAKTSRADGASLGVKIVYPTGDLGANQATSQANIAKVKVDLPKQLPSRLTTLQKACVSAQFESNPAGCPADSRVGHAVAITPILPVPLEGPAYFVSYGGAKFPELVMVLQGDNVTVQLHGETFISKAGITSSTFRTIPDVPVGTFTLTLPQGHYSALAANGNLCTVKGGLKMPTAFTGQNGAELHQDTTIRVTGCPKNKTKKKHKKAKTRKATSHGASK
jgi:hypothetical protein